MALSLSDRCEEQLYGAAIHTAAATDRLLASYPELWKTENTRINIEKRPCSEVVTGIVGEQSSGKSTLLNSICCYPILPAASVLTSERPVEIRKSINEYIQVVWTEEGQTRMIDFSRVQLEESFVCSLLEYSIDCCRECIITCDNLNYLTTRPIRTSKGTAELRMEDFDLFDPGNPRQIMMLLMILLCCHVGKRGSCTESDQREQIKMRSRCLMTRLGLDGENEFTIRLFWNSPLLPDGAVLKDLPGLRDTAGRFIVTAQQLCYLDSVVLLFNPRQEEPGLYRYLKDFLRDGKPTVEPGSLSRVTAILNKADLCAESLGNIISDIRKKCEFPIDFPIYPISAASGEYLYTTVGGVDPAATFLWKEDPHRAAEEGEKALREAFDRTYLQVALRQIQETITSEQAGRIRSLNALLWLKDMIVEFQDVKQRIALHRSFLACLEKCGTRFTKYFYEALSCACSEAQQTFESEFQLSSRRLLENLGMSEGFQEAAETIRGSLTRMESDIARTAEQYFARMKRKNFRLSLDLEENQAVFLALLRWLKGVPDADGYHLDVSEYLQPGIRRLEQALDCQYQIYLEGIGELTRKYLEFPCIFDRAFKAATETAGMTLLSENPCLTQEDLNTYREQSRILQQAVSEYLTQTLRARIRLLRSDRSVAEEFSRTGELIWGYQQILEAYYYKKCPEMLLQCRKSALFSDRISFSARKARSAFRNSIYASGARNQFLTAVDSLLTGSPEPEVSGPPDSIKEWISRLHRRFCCRNTHPQRVKQAVEELSRQFFTYTEKDLRRFSTQMKKKAKTVMNGGKNLYIAEKKQLSGVSSRYMTEINELKTLLRPVLQKMMQDKSLQKDAAAVLKLLNEL